MEQKLNSNSSAVAADSDIQPIVTTSASIEANPMLAAVEDYPVNSTVEFTEDDWNTVYTGYIVQSSIYAHLVHSSKYGRFWIPKAHVRVATTVRVFMSGVELAAHLIPQELKMP